MVKLLKGKIPKLVIGKFERPLIATVEKLDKVSEELEVHGYKIRGLSITLKGIGPIPQFRVDLVRSCKKKKSKIQ